MKTNHTTTARIQTGLIIAAASLGLLAVSLVFPLRASSAMPSMPSMPAAAPAGQPPAASTMPMNGMMNGDMMKNMGAMMKNMSTMMDNMSGMMAAAPTAGKPDAMPMADMAKMSGMMTHMSAMMGMMSAMGSGSDKGAPAMGMSCPCCEKMMVGMDMMAGPKAMAKPAPQPGDTKPATATGDPAAPDATDHSAHHPAP